MYQKIKEHERVQNFQVHKKQVFIYDQKEVLWVYGKPYPVKIDAHSLTVQDGCFLCASSVVSKTYYAFDETLQEYDKGVFPHTLEKNHIIAFDYDSTSKYYHLEWYDLVKRKTIQRIQQPIPIHSLILQHAGFLIYFDIKNRILYGLEIQTGNTVWQHALPISVEPILYAHQNQLIIQVQNECTAVNIETGTVIWRKTYAYLGTTRLNAQLSP
jgi:outer membrane protein assembly factor BamB